MWQTLIKYRLGKGLRRKCLIVHMMKCTKKAMWVIISSKCFVLYCCDCYKARVSLQGHLEQDFLCVKALPFDAFKYFAVKLHRKKKSLRNTFNRNPFKYFFESSKVKRRRWMHFPPWERERFSPLLLIWAFSLLCQKWPNEIFRVYWERKQFLHTMSAISRLEKVIALSWL